MWAFILLFTSFSFAYVQYSVMSGCPQNDYQIFEGGGYDYDNELIRGETAHFYFNASYSNDYSMELNTTSLTYYWNDEEKFGTGPVAISDGGVWYSSGYMFEIYHSISIANDLDPGVYVWLFRIFDADNSVVYCLGDTINLTDGIILTVASLALSLIL